jgi:hypothetical protein
VGGGRRLAQLLFLAIGFGVLVAVVKGQDTGVRDALGNTSAPWVIVPFLAGSRYPLPLPAALVGVAASLASLVAFYAAEAAILDLGQHPWYVDLQLTLGSGHVYEVWGIASGAVYGVLGGLWAARKLAPALAAVGLAFVLEPLVVLLLDRAGLWGGADMLFSYRWLWVGEMLFGLGAVAWALARTQGGGRVLRV